ncbi:MAG: hypothetical protein A3G34_00980 [Candidatus Lindowbacteria bacterium RIFCSPLOWO2_12_FULL_62_27]|nr:MAG: hypothetical protein A3G34_00980 [Candidatus Lindowbacteria bacterium RIFCSPLOWO2_12_FULL_62_27]OGH58279.1 MAG: hypothetical protein A3I06_09120 [Candidatus Lindowbacteria bacterium RIFCSPLOWO2_02_FULL_62_12]
MWVAILCLGMSGGPVWADETAAVREMMSWVDENMNPADEVSEATLILIHANGQQRRWQIKQYYQRAPESGSGAAILLRFLSPADLRGTTLISVNQPEGDNYQWLYLPAFRTPKFLTESGKSDYVFGSDLTFEDYVPRTMDDYIYTRLRQDKLDGRPAVVVQVAPAAKKLRDRIAYHHQLVWVDPDRAVILRVDSFDAQGRLFKTSTWKDFYQPDGRRWRARRLTVFSPLRPHWTEMTVEDIKINQGLPSDFFSESNLSSIR